MKIFFFIFTVLLTSYSCTNYEDMLYALKNKQNLEKLKKGISYDKVTEIMGDPAKEFYTEDSLKVLIYVTSIPQTAFSKSHDKLDKKFKTALVISDQILIQWDRADSSDFID